MWTTHNAHHLNNPPTTPTNPHSLPHPTNKWHNNHMTSETNGNDEVLKASEKETGTGTWANHRLMRETIPETACNNDGPSHVSAYLSPDL